MRTLVLVILFASVLAACGTGKPEGGYYSMDSDADPDKHIVLVFTHGSGPSRTPDRCKLGETDSGWGTPNAVVDLDGKAVAGKTIYLHRYCTPSRTGAPISIHDLQDSKIMRRTRDLIRLAESYRDSGFSADQIVFSGHSAGGYASILAQMERPELIGKVMAFGPAFAGRRNNRDADEWGAHDLLETRIANAEGLTVLAWLYEKDPFNAPDDLAKWKSNSGIQIVEVLGAQIDGIPCTVSNEHRIAFDDCFRDTQRERMINFIAR